MTGFRWKIKALRERVGSGGLVPRAPTRGATPCPHSKSTDRATEGAHILFQHSHKYNYEYKICLLQTLQCIPRVG